MVRSFNTAGPCFPEDHYMLPPLRRLPQAVKLVEQRGYFVIHAPRQTGKTTALGALAHQLTASGQYAALYISCEVAKGITNDFILAQHGILKDIRSEAESVFPAELQPPPWPEAPGTNLLLEALKAWTLSCPRPLVLLFDEIDTLQGQTLTTVLTQLRSGFYRRRTRFPSSIILCGMRDVRDYKRAAGGDPTRQNDASPFNVHIRSIRLDDFTSAEIAELYGQHTSDTGQQFTAESVERVFELTQGQPWLVNALASEVVENIATNGEPITVEHIEGAKESLIRARATHVDSLIDRLKEPRIRHVIEPVIAGQIANFDNYVDDLSYVHDLGLIAPTDPLEIANPIYREIILRVLGDPIGKNITVNPRNFVLPDGRLDFELFLREFAQFWQENGEILSTDVSYHEVAPHLVLMAYLQRVINGGGYVEREYGIGRGRIDLLVRWPYSNSAGKRDLQREALELKVWRTGKPDPLAQGLEQLDGYLDRLDLDQGVLVVFDRRKSAADIVQRTKFEEAISPAGRKITVLRG